MTLPVDTTPIGRFVGFVGFVGLVGCKVPTVKMVAMDLDQNRKKNRSLTTSSEWKTHNHLESWYNMTSVSQKPHLANPFEGVAIFLENTAQKPFTLYAYVTIYIRAKHKPLTWNTTKQTQKK